MQIDLPLAQQIYANYNLLKLNITVINQSYINDSNSYTKMPLFIKHIYNTSQLLIKTLNNTRYIVSNTLGQKYAHILHKSVADKCTVEAIIKEQSLSERTYYRMKNMAEKVFYQNFILLLELTSKTTEILIKDVSTSSLMNIRSYIQNANTGEISSVVSVFNEIYGIKDTSTPSPSTQISDILFISYINNAIEKLLLSPQYSKEMYFIASVIYLSADYDSTVFIRNKASLKNAFLRKFTECSYEAAYANMQKSLAIILYGITPLCINKGSILIINNIDSKEY